MTARDRLLASLAPELVAALEELIDERLADAGVRGEEGDGSPWLSIAEAAERLRVSERTLERRIAGGRVRSKTIGRRRLLHRDDVDGLAQSGNGGGSSVDHSTPSPRGVR